MAYSYHFCPLIAFIMLRFEHLLLLRLDFDLFGITLCSYYFAYFRVMESFGLVDADDFFNSFKRDDDDRDFSIKLTLSFGLTIGFFVHYNDFTRLGL